MLVALLFFSPPGTTHSDGAATWDTVYPKLLFQLPHVFELLSSWRRHESQVAR
jgi:hypothetical protein